MSAPARLEAEQPRLTLQDASFPIGWAVSITALNVGNSMFQCVCCGVIVELLLTRLHHYRCCLCAAMWG